MRTLILTVCFAAGIAVPWHAARAETLKSKAPRALLEEIKKKKGERNQAHVIKMAEDLSLSEDQQRAVITILKEDEEQKYAIVRQAADQIEEVNVQTEKKIVSQLNEEQKQLYTGEAKGAEEDIAGLLKVFR